MSEEKLIGRKTGPVAEIIFNNPERHNATSLDMWQRMGAFAEEFAKDPEIRVLVVSGAGGKAFVSGADISKFETERAGKDASDHYNRTSAKAYAAVYNFPRPTIAKITGYCIGGGAALAVCCDLRFCDDKAKFGIPAGKLGLGYGHAGLQRLVEVVGQPAALDMFYSARQMDAAEALRLGLVNRVVATAELDKTVADYCDTVAGNAPMTIATIKAASRELNKPSTERDLGKIDRMVQDCFASQDYIEGRRAFMAKRKPKFQGK